ncbi:MAG TPA: sialidase family protein, partial [Abditibacteriaceae bacterium]|nr:sialidase family protein [Abditibacteriaceae bacterium]
NAALFVAQRNRLLTITDLKFEPSLEGAHSEYSAQLHITVRDPDAAIAAQPFISDFGFRQGLYVSFCHPIEDSRGRLLVPVMWQKVDDGSIRQRGFPTRDDLPDVLMDVWEVALLIGEFDENGAVAWRVGNAVPCAFEKSSRGMNEGTVAELNGGRLAMVLRGSNAGWPDKPGYKWLSFSFDGGDTWTEATPLACDDGSTLESSATGSALFRSIKNGKLYWIGNLCLHGERPNGNMPRTPLVMAEVEEEPFALRRDTITIIDQRAEHEDDQVQMSNFRFYQDRVTGDVVLYLTRYGERGSQGLDWMQADNYQYRVGLG